ncbi:heparinase II/III family protein [Rheinheimera baltica]|uniref:heparinase II/III family protein n=1 Tax=Rheinheimera baltica TaxID=67576 RepID=UPI00273D6343|nr:heparinase II/III family protein [Rheinheimera baltica]MDP5189004.1 heparinase II/III family protein [Rheinheimera baltica]
MQLSCYSNDFDNFIKAKILQIIKTPANFDLGSKLVLHQELVLPPFPSTTFNHFSDWECNPFGNRSWQWKLNWFAFIPGLIAYFDKSKDDMAIQLAVKGIKNWITRYIYSDKNHTFEFIWHDHGTALRAEQLVLFYYYYQQYYTKQSTQLESLTEVLQDTLEIHGEKLSSEVFYSSNTNHGLEQSRVLLLLSIVLKGPKATVWRQLAIERISNELKHAFTDEGIHVENSPAYHIFVFKVFINILHQYKNYLPENLNNKFSKISEKALIFITHIIRPDGNLPPVGDTEQLTSTDGYFHAYKDKEQYKNTLYSLRMGKQGLKPTVNNRVFPLSGYSIFRNFWPSQEHYDYPLHIIIKTGSLSHYHYHKDEGHISVFGAGEDWLIDSGLYNYNEDSDMRRYVRSRQAHNVVLFTDSDYSPDKNHRLSNWRITNYSENDSNPFVDMEINVIENIHQRRIVNFNALTSELSINDFISSNNGNEEDMIIQWHFPEDKKIDITEEEISISSTTGNKMTLKITGDKPDKIDVIKGIIGDTIYSCQSCTSNNYRPSQVILLKFDKRNILKTNCKFTLESYH